MQKICNDGRVDGTYVARLADAQLESLIRQASAVMVVGPRASGKTTTARRLVVEVVHLDDPTVAATFRADPDAALRRVREPVLLDEWQEVPEVLGAVKRAVDAKPGPGRFLLTGSVEAPLTGRMWPGTGRVITVVLHGLVQRELVASPGSGLMEWARAAALEDVRIPPGRLPDIDDYVELAAAGGFPEALLRWAPAERPDWLGAYVDLVATRDTRSPGGVADPVRFRRYLEVVALNTAGLPSDLTLAQAGAIDPRTADAYDRMLQARYLTDHVPAWGANRLARLTKRAKRYVVDPGLAMAAALIGVDDVLRSPDLVGRMLDTFVAAQLRPEVALTRYARLHHLRTEGGRQEIDLLIDLGRGRVVAVEVKAGAVVDARDARHLAWLRDSIGEDFVRGIVLHTGPGVYELGDRLWALPICALWNGTLHLDGR